MATYRIIDEPAPSGLSPWTVKPLWPLFAMMFAGAWLAFPWFVFNAFAMGSAHRGRQIAWAVAGFLGAGVVLGLIWTGFWLKLYPVGALSYLYTAVILWKLGVAYVLYLNQSPSFELHQYAGGGAKNGMFVVIAGFYVARNVLTERLAALDDKVLMRFIEGVFL